MTYKVFGGMLSLNQSINQWIITQTTNRWQRPDSNPECMMLFAYYCWQRYTLQEIYTFPSCYKVLMWQHR